MAYQLTQDAHYQRAAPLANWDFGIIARFFYRGDLRSQISHLLPIVETRRSIAETKPSGPAPVHQPHHQAAESCLALVREPRQPEHRAYQHSRGR